MEYGPLVTCKQIKPILKQAAHKEVLPYGLPRA